MSSIELRDMRYTVLNSEQTVPLLTNSTSSSGGNNNTASVATTSAGTSQQQQQQLQPPKSHIRHLSIAKGASGFNFNISPFNKKKELNNSAVIVKSLASYANANAGGAAAATAASNSLTSNGGAAIAASSGGLAGAAVTSGKLTNGGSFSTIDSWPSKITLNATDSYHLNKQREKSAPNLNPNLLFFPTDRRFSHLSMEEANAIKSMAYETQNYMPPEENLRLSNLLRSLFQRCKNRNNKENNYMLNNRNVNLPLKAYFKRLLFKLLRFAVGLVFCLAVCACFNTMVFILRGTFNGIKIIESLNSTAEVAEMSDSIFKTGNHSIGSLIRTGHLANKSGLGYQPQSAISPLDFSIETNYTRTYTSNCNFCYFLVWTTTSCLIVCYPVFVVLYYLIECFKSRNRFPPFVKKSDTNSSAINAGAGASGAMNPNNTATSVTTTSTTTSTNSNNQNSQNNNSNKKKNCKPNFQRYENLRTMLTSSFQIFETSTNIMLSKQDSATYTLRMKRRDFVFKLAAITFVWLITGYTFVKALDILNCLDVVILFSINFSLIYMAAWIIMHNQFIPLRLLGFILSIAALIFVYYSDGFQFDFKFVGNVCATTSAAGSALLQVIWKSLSKTKSHNHMTMLLTLVGLFNLFFCWPIVLLLKLAQVETLTILSNEYADIELSIKFLLSLVVACALGLVYSFILIYGSLVTHEIYLEVGCFLTIPISAIIDVYVNQVTLSDLKIGALFSICTGYIFLILPENLYTDLSKRFCRESQEVEQSSSLTRRYRHSTLPTAHTLYPNQGTVSGGSQQQPSSKLFNLTNAAIAANNIQAQMRTSNLSISRSNN